MSKEIAAKFLAVRKTLDLTLREMFEKTGISASYYSMIERGLRDPEPRIIDDLFTGLGVSEKWWDTGDGEMFADRGGKIQGALTDMEVTIVNLFRQLNPVQKRAVLGLAAALIETSE